MNKQYAQWVGILIITAGILALLGLAVGLAGVNYDFDVFWDTTSLIAAGATAAEYIRWSYWLNMMGNYLLLIPLAVLFHAWLKPADARPSQLYAIAGIFYLGMGAAGSAILAAAWPFLMERFAEAAVTQQDFLIIQFQVVAAIADEGLHGVIQNLGGLVWFLGAGNLLRTRWKRMGIFAMVIGGFLVVNILGNLFNIQALSLLGLTANILLGPLWSIILGIMLYKMPLDPDKVPR